MFSTETIASMARAAAIRARANEVEPYAPHDQYEVSLWRRFPFPNLGDYRPAGWTLVAYETADASGLGAEYEPALTVRGLKEYCLEWLEKDPTVGFGIIETGQFQVVVGVFSQDPDAVPCHDPNGQTLEGVTWYECPNCGEPIEDGEESCEVCDWYLEEEDEDCDDEDEDDDSGVPSAYQAGHDAFKDGAPVTGNPYPTYTIEHGAWADGWGDAKADYLDDIQQKGQGTLFPKEMTQ